jgi:guanylate kinase
MNSRQKLMKSSSSNGRKCIKVPNGTLRTRWIVSGTMTITFCLIGCGRAVNLKQFFGERALSVFIMPPSIEELQRRLEKRGMDSPEKIRKRINKAGYEIKFVSKFDRTIINDDLKKALQEADEMVFAFLTQTQA